MTLNYACFAIVMLAGAVQLFKWARVSADWLAQKTIRAIDRKTCAHVVPQWADGVQYRFGICFICHQTQVQEL